LATPPSRRRPFINHGQYRTKQRHFKLATGRLDSLTRRHWHTLKLLKALQSPVTVAIFVNL
jgi:hypothetical protein